MEIRTKDGIVLKGVPDGTPEAEIRARIDSIRAGNTIESTEQNKSVVAPDTPEIIRQKLAKAKAELAKTELTADEKAAIAPDAFSPKGKQYNQNYVDFAAGASGIMRGGANLISDGLGEKLWPTKLADKDSGAYMAGTIADPVSWAVMGGLSKLPVVGKALNLTPIAGKGKMLQIAKNMVRGSVSGGILGGLSDDGTVGEGALAGGVVGGVVPTAIAAGKYTIGGLGNFIDTIGTSLGKEGSTKRLTKQAIERTVGDSKNKIIDALNKAKLDEINKVGSSTIPGYKQTVAEVIAKPQIGKPDQFGGSVIRLQKDLTGASGLEDALTGTARSQKTAMLDFTKNTNQVTTPMREAALASANKSGGVDITDLTTKIDDMRNAKGVSKLAKKTLKSVKKDIIAGSVNGKIDANDLYTLRKEIGNTIGTYSKETQNWDKKVTSGLERDIQKKIDDAIEFAGGKGWKEYLQKFSGGRKTVSDVIAAQKEAKLIGSGVKSSISENIKEGKIPHLPTLLSRPMMAINYALKIVSEDATKPIEKEVVKSLQNPDLFAKYLKEPITSPMRKKAEEVITKALIIAKAQQGEQ